MTPQEVADRYHIDLPHCGARWPNTGPAGREWTCTLDADHDGDHAATGAGGKRIFSTACP
jgi:hypothetical protein